MPMTPYDDDAPPGGSRDDDIPLTAWVLVGIGLVAAYIFALALLHSAA